MAGKHGRIEVLGLSGIPEVRSGDDLVELALDACARDEIAVEDRDVFVFTQKVVSKSEGRFLSLRGISPSEVALRFGERWGRDPKLVEVALQEAHRVVRMDRGVLITETAQGLVCANSGVDASNAGSADTLCLLPRDPDASAAALAARIRERTGKTVAVLVTDTFGRPWREGQTNVAIGVAGMTPLADYRGRLDPQGRHLTASVIAIADEIAAAAELVMGKLERIPVAVVRGCPYTPSDGSARSLVRDREHDLFP
jgi:coenzyme F420-0:L-glutamate ligase/coenzyme F420-1:gamma-L-glutamate ligase